MSPASRPLKVSAHRLGAQEIAAPLVHINSFGAFVKYLREREQLSSHDLTVAFPEYFEEHRASQFLITPDMYRKIEKGTRAPQYEELLPLYAALLGCGCKLTLQECSAYVRLARTKIERLQRRRPKLRPTGEWRMLEIRLSQLGLHAGTGERDGEILHTVEKRVHPKSVLTFDVSHVVGREQWLSRMLSYLAENPKKLAVIRGMMGVGKTPGLKLLLQQFQRQEHVYPIFYTFSPAENVTPADHLQAFLAMILVELDSSEPEAAKTVPLETFSAQVLTRIVELEQRVVLLVDDAQVILNNQGQLSLEWEQFLTVYLGSSHQALMYLAAREWPLWLGRERSYLADGDDAVLPMLDKTASIHIWHRLGFTDVPEPLLEQATRKCGSNPLMIELRAASLGCPRFSFSLDNRKETSETPLSQKSEHHQLIECLLDEAQVFTTADVDAMSLLQQVVSHRLSYDALQLLEVLAASPLALPFHLLAEINEATAYAFMELLHASLIDRTTMHTDDRATLQPLAREAGIQRLRTEKRLAEVEEQLVRIYQAWLQEGTFRSEQEQAALISELTIMYLKQHHLLEASELLVEYGWLSFVFGHAQRVARIADEVMKSFHWRLSATNEFGGLLLYYYLLVRFFKRDLDATDRKKTYLHLYNAMSAGSVPLNLQTLVHLTTHKLLYMVRERCYEEAWSLIDALCVRYKDLQNSRPTTYAELLDRRAFVLGRWGDFQDAQAKKEQEHEVAKHTQQEAFRHRQEAVVVHQQCIEILQQCERFASPIEQSRIRFKRARLLNDLAYYQRCVGELEEARRSMEDCLKLKEAGYVVPISLAVSYDDYSQLLSQLGAFRSAKLYNDRALQIAQDQVATGSSSAPREKGMFLINRGKLCLLLGQLEEARKLFEEGIPLVEGTLRDESVTAAREGLQVVETWQRENPRDQLDWRWFPEYQRLSTYSDVGLLAQAGPFLVEEQNEWNLLWPNREDEAVKKRLSTLINQSRKRELAACIAEQRNPSFHYPLVDQEEMPFRKAGFQQMSAEVQRNEPNVIVRRLYHKAIEERLNELCMIEAAGDQDDERFWEYNKRMNGLPSRSEMELALRPLADLIRRGLRQDNTREISQRLLQQTNHWSVQLMSLEPVSGEQEKGQQAIPSGTTEMYFSPETVERYFADVFRRYQFSWEIVYDPTIDHARVNLSRQQLILPEGKKMATTKIRQLLGHEIEIHSFRSSSGERSPLALLSTGLAGYLDAEEGLALDYTEETAHVSNAWFGTLATGLATGIICKPLPFRDLLPFFGAVHLLTSLLEGKTAPLVQLQEEAHKRAQNRCLRTWRGVSHFGVPGICSTKDCVYLRGYLAVKDALQAGKATFDQLMVGSVGLHHLDDLAELGIVRPAVVHQRLSADPDLEKDILQFAEQ